jgi:glycosyltransferase involved in cell wall biosynthesis
MKDIPLVSIALCTYNGEKFLVKQLESILNQDYSNIEVIITDDCSSDTTREILEAYQKKDEKIKLYLNESNLGYTKNFEKAVGLCAGDYIAFSDQDDIWEKSKISELVAEMPGNVMVFHNSDLIDDSDNQIGNYTVSNTTRIYDGESCLPFLFSNCVHGHATLFESRLKEYLIPFDDRYSHDWWLAYVAFNIGKVKYIDKILVHYRQHQSSITDTLKLRREGNESARPVRGIDRILPDLDMIKYCAEFKSNRDPELMKKAYYLLSSLAKGKERVKTFIFLVKYFDLLFYMRFKPKNFFSKLNMARKICFD